MMRKSHLKLYRHCRLCMMKLAKQRLLGMVCLCCQEVEKNSMLGVREVDLCYTLLDSVALNFHHNHLVGLI